MITYEFIEYRFDCCMPSYMWTIIIRWIIQSDSVAFVQLPKAIFIFKMAAFITTLFITSLTNYICFPIPYFWHHLFMQLTECSSTIYPIVLEVILRVALNIPSFLHGWQLERVNTVHVLDSLFCFCSCFFRKSLIIQNSIKAIMALPLRLNKSTLVLKMGWKV